MSAERYNRDAMARLSAANPASAAKLRATIGESDLRQKMTAAIAAGKSSGDPAFTGHAAATGFGIPRIGRRGFLTDRRRATLLAGFAGAGLATLVILLVGMPGSGSHPQFATAAIEVAEANPRLLVTEPGWSVTHAGEFQADEGEVTFSGRRHWLSVNWYPARQYRSYLRDRASVSRPQTSRLLGRVATTVRYGPAEYATMLSPRGTVFIEVRGRLGSHAEYEAVLHSLRSVDVTTWLSAMPPSVVRPDARAKVVERMLHGVPLPPAFDLARLEGGSWVADHYQLAVKVAGAVSCGWVESWLAATKAGDDSHAREAVEAMATSRRWPMMPTLTKGGGWSANVLHVADEIERGHLDRGAVGELVKPDGTGYKLGPSWAMALGCESHYWRRPLHR
ncbi:MAG: hypothetical protein ACM3N0_07640 [Chloroflexota bacterium]